MSKAKMCEWCGEHPPVHLGPAGSGPVFGLELEGETDAYCSHECWEADQAYEMKMADPNA
jgi:hypothetical protein